MIGACGQSGDATVPHLHFSYFTASGAARNPMHALLGWLHRAEHRAGVRPSNGHGVPTPPMAELATPSVMHPRPETTTTGVVWAPATDVVAPGGGFDGDGVRGGSRCCSRPSRFSRRAGGRAPG